MVFMKACAERSWCRECVPREDMVGWCGGIPRTVDGRQRISDRVGTSIVCNAIQCLPFIGLVRVRVARRIRNRTRKSHTENSRDSDIQLYFITRRSCQAWFVRFNRIKIMVVNSRNSNASDDLLKRHSIFFSTTGSCKRDFPLSIAENGSVRSR